MGLASKYGSAWEKAMPSRYRRVSEIYMAAPGGGSNRVYQHLKGLRSGPYKTAAVAARGLEKSQANEPQPVAPPAPKPDKGGALAAIGKGIQTAIGWEQQLTKVFGKIPFPSFAALTVGDWSIGLPHGHMHPPNLIPPSTVPIPMPSAGPVIQIPILSGAERTKHAGKSAAMCGDMGVALAPWCGGYVPMFEVYFGSAHVWIESARAARGLCDIVQHCTFTTPKPSDPPLGPMVGATVGAGVAHVQIGGMPLPSFFSIAVGKAFQGLAGAGGKIYRKLKAKSFVDELIRPGKTKTGLTKPPAIQFDKSLSDAAILAMERDLVTVASTRTGRRALKRIAKANKKKGFTLTMLPNKPGEAHGWSRHGHMDGYRDWNTGKPGPGHHAEVAYNPSDYASKNSPSDAVLNHELNHAANAMEGKIANNKGTAAHGWGAPNPHLGGAAAGPTGRWRDFEEFETTHFDNAYRRERGLKQRKNYGQLPK